MNPVPWAIDRLAVWITAREALRQRKEAGQPAPWTDDPILQQFRFCNVRREDDRVTRWIATHWREPHADDPYLWHAMIVARMFNWPPTLQAMGYPKEWNTGAIYGTLAAQPGKVFSAAYVVSTNGVKVQKLRYVLDNLKQLRLARNIPRQGDTLAQAHAKLVALNGLADFLAGQVVADLKHTPVLAQAADWWEWAVPGPGSQRGLSRVCALDLQHHWKPATFLSTVRQLRDEVAGQWPELPRLCLQDWQNCLCEYDKYERVRLGQGRPRSYYRPETAY